MFYICGSANITTPTELNTGDCVKNSGAQFLRASGTAGEQFIQYPDVYAPMAESADGMPEYLGRVEVTSFLGNCPSASGDICVQGKFAEISGNLHTYT